MPILTKLFFFFFFGEKYDRQPLVLLKASFSIFQSKMSNFVLLPVLQLVNKPDAKITQSFMAQTKSVAVADMESQRHAHIVSP